MGGQCDVNIPSLSRSKAVASDYRHSTGVDFEPNEHAANGVTAGQARHNSSNVGGVTGQVGHNSSKCRCNLSWKCPYLLVYWDYFMTAM